MKFSSISVIFICALAVMPQIAFGLDTSGIKSTFSASIYILPIDRPIYEQEEIIVVAPSVAGVELMLRKSDATDEKRLGVASRDPSDTDRWLFLLNARDLTDGRYFLRAKAALAGAIVLSPPMEIQIERISSSPITTQQETLRPSILLSLSQQSVIQNDLEIVVYVTDAQSVKIYLSDMQPATSNHIGDALRSVNDASKWQLHWDSRSVPNGIYKIGALVTNVAGTYGSSPYDITIYNQPVQISLPSPTPSPTALQSIAPSPHISPTQTILPSTPTPSKSPSPSPYSTPTLPPLQPPKTTKEEKVREEIKESITKDIKASQEVVQAVAQRTESDSKQDSDKDGIADYDETKIFGTNPKVADTDGDGTSDGNELLTNRSPVDRSTNQSIPYKDPREEGTAKPNLLSVEKITVENKTLVVNGKGPPNMFVTIYIFSTPIIVTVKTNAEGEWSYVFDKELADGSHHIYATIASSKGDLIAKSNPLSFVKEAEAITTTQMQPERKEPNLFRDSTIAFAIFLITSIVGIAFIIIGVVGSRHGTSS